MSKSQHTPGEWVNRGGDWGEIKHLWPEGVDATSKGLCDYIRKAIAKAKDGVS